MPTESAFLLAGLLFIAAALGYVFARYGDTEDEEDIPDRLDYDRMARVVEGTYGAIVAAAE